MTVIALAALVLAFGLVTVAFAYRLEDSRLMKVYDELRDAIALPPLPNLTRPALLREKQIQELIVFRRQVHGRSVVSQADNDAAMFLHKS